MKRQCAVIVGNLVLLAWTCWSFQDVDAADPYVQQGIKLFNAKNYTQAQRYFDESLKSSRTATCLYYAALTRVYTGDSSSGAKLMHEIVEHFPQSTEAVLASKFLSASTQSLSTQTPGSNQVKAPSEPSDLAIPFSRVEGQIRLNGEVGGRRYVFLFETGAPVTRMGRQSLVEAGLGQSLVPNGKIEQSGVMINSWTNNIGITVAGFQRTVPVLVYEYLLGPARLSDKFFDGYVVTVDNGAGVLRLKKKDSNEAKTIGCDTIDIPFARTDANVFVQVRVNGRDVRARFDTGTQGLVLSEADAKRIDLNFPQQSQAKYKSGKLYWDVPGNMVEIGSIRKSNYTVQWSNLDTPCSVVGQSFFADRNYVIDEDRHLIRFAR